MLSKSETRILWLLTMTSDQAQHHEAARTTIQAKFYINFEIFFE